MSKNNIMIIDDSASIRQVLKFTLENAGYNVFEAQDGQIALNMLASDEIAKLHLIISDVNMPNVDGLTFLKKLKQEQPYTRHKFTPVVMLTTEGSNEMKNMGRESGAKAWVTKPFAPEQILKVIDKLIA